VWAMWADLQYFGQRTGRTGANWAAQGVPSVCQLNESRSVSEIRWRDFWTEIDRTKFNRYLRDVVLRTRIRDFVLCLGGSKPAKNQPPKKPQKLCTFIFLLTFGRDENIVARVFFRESRLLAQKVRIGWAFSTNFFEKLYGCWGGQKRPKTNWFFF
jgi:hypothetical protein